ncbi:MAG: SDR family NAD(P)-dependent oxidoreductase [Solirubrobacteraceae bacterium]
MRLEAGKVAVVTGAAGGIGLALAERFARDGLNVVLADVQADALANAADQVGALGVETLAVPTDVSDEAAVQALAAAAVERFGGVHVVCNNAGVGTRADPWFGPLSAWQWVIGLNLWGVIHGTRLGDPPPAVRGSEVVTPIIKKALDEGKEPAEIADLVADAITDGRFWVLPHPEFVEIAARRWRRIADGEDPELEVDVPGMPPIAEIVGKVKALLAMPSA